MEKRVKRKLSTLNSVNNNFIKCVLLVIFFFGGITSATAQLSDLHYLPPLKQVAAGEGVDAQRVYLSTPETTAFNVNVYQGTNGTPITTLTGLSNSNSITYTLANSDNNITLVSNANTGVVLSTAGLRFESTGGQEFYVNYRGSRTSQGTSLTSKGRSALGTQFKWGGIPLRSTSTASQSATLGIMATQANTNITISGYDPNCVFRQGTNAAGITSNTINITLNANQSYVLEAILAQATANESGWLGASIVADKDIVVSNGGMLNMVLAGSASRDSGIDQAVPEDIVGSEYVFVRGNGANGMEIPIIIAIQDNTEIYVNGSATPIATINNGDFFEIPSTNYSTTSAGGNMFVTTSNRAYAYQALAGSTSEATGGLNFIAPVSCLMPKTLDNIPNIQDVAGVTFTGGVTIIASTSTPDGNITVTDGGGAVTLPASNTVAGTSDWKTFFISGLTGNVTVNSTGPISVGFLGANASAGVAGYFSGFDTAPVVDVQITGGGCLPSGTVEETTGAFDAYQWYMDGVAVPGATSSSYTPPAYVTFAELYVQVTQGTCSFNSDSISVYDCDPDIVLTKTADATTYGIGDTVTYTITAESKGVDPVTNLVITDILPTGLTLVSGTPTAGSWSSPNWTIGTMNSGEKHTLTLTATVNNDVLSHYLVNTVTNSQDQVDGNNTVDDPSETILIDFDGDGLAGINDLDSDNDGILDSNEGTCKGTSSNPFTSLGAARSVAVAGVYYFELNGQTFSTYVNENGYVQVAIDFGNGTGNLPQSTSLTNSARGLLSNTALAELTDANEIRFASSTGEVDLTTSNATLLTRLVAGQTLHGGIPDNAINEDWTGTQEQYLRADASCTSTHGTTLAANIFHPCGNSFTVHWIPSLGSVRVRNDLGDIGATESLTLWVRAPNSSCATDTDSDQRPDYLDTDSDNDGCFDALEGAGSYNHTQLSSGAFTGGVDGNGVPSTTSGGQATTAAVTDNSDSSACCPVSVSGFADIDSDGVADICDQDNDNDGILDTNDSCSSQILDLGSFDGLSAAIGGTPVTSSIALPGAGTGENVDLTLTHNGTSGTVSAVATGGIFSTRDPSGDNSIIQFGTMNVNSTQESTAQFDFDTLISNVSFAITDIDGGNGAGPEIAIIEGYNDGSLVATPTITLVSNSPMPYQSGNNLSGSGSNSANTIQVSFSEPLDRLVIKITGAQTSNVSLTVSVFNINYTVCNDTDLDGTKDYLDVDSDNDGCYDALEGSGSYTDSQLSSGVFTGGVDANGIPSTTSGGQASTAAVTDDSDNTTCCTVSVSGFDDFDSDGVADSCDLDNDNDGILDSVECTLETVVLPISVSSTDSDFNSPDNGGGTAGSLNNTIDGDLGTFIADVAPSSGYTDVSYTFPETDMKKIRIYNNGGGILGDAQAISYIGEIRLYDASNTLKAVIPGKAIPNGDAGGSPFEIDALYQDVTRVEFLNLSGMTNGICWRDIQLIANVDSDGDGTPDCFDVDSDNDGCYDALEAAGTYNHTQLSSGAFTGGVDADGIPTVTSGGQATTAAVTDNSDSTACCTASVSGFTDSDSDGVVDSCDLDNDNDGILDSNEQACTTRQVWDSTTSTGSIVIGGKTVNFTTSLTGPGSFTGSNNSSGHITFDNNNTPSPPTVWTITFDTPVSFEAFSKTTGAWFDDGETWKITSSGATFTVDNPDNSLNIVSGVYTNEVVFGSPVSGSNDNKLWSIKSSLLTSVSISYEQSVNNAGAIQIAVNCIATDTDNDGTPDYLDVDSDNDGCNDVLESGGTDGDSDGDLDGTGFDSNGQVTGGTGGYNGVNGNETEATTLQVDTQPSDATICLGTNVTFTGAASSLSTTTYTGTAPTTTPDYSGSTAATADLVYQWQEQVGGAGAWNNITNGGIYSNATTASLTLTNPLIGASTNKYRLVVTSTKNVCASVTSSEATLTINNVTGGTIAANQTICSGGDPVAFTETVASTGGGTLSYQWESSTDGSSFTPIGGATNTTYDVGVLTQNMWYRREVSSLLNGVTCTTLSNVVQITVDPVPTISIDDVTVSEGTTANFTATLSQAIACDVTFDVTTSNGTATAGDDYTAQTSQTYTITAGSTTVTIPIVTINDTTYEPTNETYTVTMSNVQTGIGNSITTTDLVGAGTITDLGDNAPTISIDDITVAEGSTANFTATLSNPSQYDVTFDVSTSDGSATAGDDYTAQSSVSYTIPAGSTTVTIPVVTINDTTYEPTNETYTVTMSNVSIGSTPAEAITTTDLVGAGTITDLGDSAPTISIDDITVAEGSTANFTATLSNPSQYDVTFDVTTSDGSATAGDDYTAQSSVSYTIPAGSTTVTIPVVTINDTTYEPTNETYTVTMSNVSIGSTPAEAITTTDLVGAGTITDLGDSAPTISIDDITVAEGSTANFTATLSN
ncbi:Calx-beta domain-containing protein, partial [Tenacibaculum xiamenense]|uniref:Calx-beta domain-containing protein n=1 Tax=Tenacibaculum xiamenense TaxID=1261553 RepID=UPI0038B5EED4